MSKSQVEPTATAGSSVSCALSPYCSTVSRWWAGVCNRGGTTNYGDRRVLVADDEAPVAHMLDSLIHARLACEVTTVSNGDDVLRLLDAEPYDVLLTDMIMPGLHGLDLVSTVHEKWPGVSIIVMSGFPQDFPYVEVVDAGASDFIGKPFLPAELEAKLRRILQERDERDERILAEIKYRSLFELSMNGMVLADPVSLKIVDTNEAFCDLCGRNREALIGVSLSDLLSPREQERFRQALSLFARGGKGALGDVSLVRPERGDLSLDVSVTHIDTLLERFFFLSFRDVTDRLEVDKQLTRMAQTDQLTGLANKHTFNMRLEWTVARARREKFMLTLLALDLDNLKQCNDTYGHLIGDEVLVKVGEVIRNNIRVGGDEGFRCGGDEFAVLLAGAPAVMGKGIAERIRAQYEEMENYNTTISIGIAELREGMSATDLVRTADETLYRAKALGKNGIQVAS